MIDVQKVADSLVGNTEATKAFMHLINHNKQLRKRVAMAEILVPTEDINARAVRKLGRYARRLGRLADRIHREFPDGFRKNYFSTELEHHITAADFWLAQLKLPPILKPTKESEDDIRTQGQHGISVQEPQTEGHTP